MWLVFLFFMGCCGEKDLSQPPPPLTSPTRIVVVTGASAGLGLELVKQLIRNENNFIAILTARNPKAGEEALHKLDPYHQYSDRVIFLQLDVTSSDSIQRFAGDIHSQFGYIDVLVNNAGINPEGWDFSPKDSFPLDVAKSVMGTNFFGAVNVTTALLPMFREGGHVVNIGSKLGKFHQIPGDSLRAELSSNTQSSQDVVEIGKRYIESVRKGTYLQDGWPQHNYITSKVLLHVYTRALAREQTGRIRVNALCPGWTKTTIGGPLAPKSLEAGVRTYLMLVKSKSNSTGQFYEDERVSSFY